MATFDLPASARPNESVAPATEASSAACSWEEELLASGVRVETPWIYSVGIPLLAALILAGTGIAAAIDGNLTWLAAALLIAAAIPWIAWILFEDDGPNWPFLIAALAPVALLSTGHWFIDAIGPVGRYGAYLLPLTAALLVIPGVIFADRALAIGFTILPYLAFSVPLIAALIDGRESGAGLLVTWSMGFALTALAAYTIRMSYDANRQLADAHLALARQQRADERRQIARDVHDVVAHTLAVTMLHITAARMAVSRGDTTAAEEALEEAEAQGRASLADVRRVVRLLRADAGTSLAAAQPDLTDLGDLIAASRAAGLDLHFTDRSGGARTSPAAELALYRVLQESLTNAARYGAGVIEIELHADANELRLTVRNDLAGDRAATIGAGSGLNGMRERIDAVGGRFEAGVRDGRWVVTATAPRSNGATS